jgi:crotonobetainyl-CoA:carnitine CoA-transferase CaiB-like acyl-CoA transferase
VARLVVEAGVADPELLERFADTVWAESFEAREELLRYVQQYIATHSAEEAYHAAQALHLAWGAIRRPEDNLTDAQFLARGNLVDIEHEGLGKLPYTTAPWLADKVPWQIYRRAPRLGEHNTDIYCGELGVEDHRLQQFRAANVL